MYRIICTKGTCFLFKHAWVFLEHYIKMLSSTCIQCNKNFQYPMLLLILNSFFLCFNSFLLYLQTLLILFKVYHACVLVYHGVPTSNCNFRVVSPSGKITDTALQEGHEFNVRMPERPEKVRWIGHMMWVLKPGPLFLFDICVCRPTLPKFYTYMYINYRSVFNIWM